MTTTVTSWSGKDASTRRTTTGRTGPRYSIEITDVPSWACTLPAILAHWASPPRSTSLAAITWESQFMPGTRIPRSSSIRLLANSRDWT